MAYRGRAVLHRLASRRVALVRRTSGVGGYQLDGARLHNELFGSHLHQGGLDALAQLRLAREHRDHAVAVYAYP
jgi:hypothetical protein